MRVFSRSLAIAALLVGSTNGLAQTGGVQAAVDALIGASAHAHWGMSVVDAATGATLYANNDAQLFEPASNAKLFTTSAALALLGPTYTMGTRVLADGTVDATGTLHGNLRLQGGADPTLSGRVYPYSGHTDRTNPPLGALDTLAAQVLATGIHAIDGQVVGDDTLFADERYGAGWGWDDLLWEYGAPVSALTINDNVRYLTVAPSGIAGRPVTTAWVPDLPSARGALSNTAVTSPSGSPAALGLARLPEGAGIRVYGSLPANGAPVHLAVAFEDPALFAARAFAAALAADGITLNGGAVAVHRSSQDTEPFASETHTPVTVTPLSANASSLPAASGARLVASRTSVPLSAIVTVTNKVSQNLHAELLLRLLGHAEGTDGSAAQGARVVRAFLTTEAGIAPDDFVLYDGSGLSTRDLVTPRAVTTLLRYSSAQPWGQLLADSLPVSGVDGSLSARLTTLRGRVHAKTGTLGEVDALSGFLTADSGRTVIFSILCNDYAGSGSRTIVDGLVAAIAHNF